MERPIIIVNNDVNINLNVKYILLYVFILVGQLNIVQNCMLSFE
jgi:hypothetical protein